MKWMDRLRGAFQNLMQGRHGADQLGFVLVYGGLIVYVLGALFGLGILTLLGLACWGWGLFRMLSKNRTKRFEENRKYLELKNKLTLELKQAQNRFKNRKQYCYFRCPQCKSRLRLPRHLGEVTARCKNCGNSFPKKT